MAFQFTLQHSIMTFEMKLKEQIKVIGFSVGYIS